MNKDRIKELIERFDQGKLSDQELSELEKLVETGTIDLNDFPELEKFSQRLNLLETPVAGPSMDKSFYTMLEGKIREQKNGYFLRIGDWIRNLPGLVLANRISYAALMILAGFFLGIVFKAGNSNKQIHALSAEVRQMHETLMVSLLEKSEVTDRLRAVNLTSRMPDADDTVIDALVNTLNNDDNMNVRLAAIEALVRYSRNEKARRGLIESIASQDSPLVLVTLADALVAIHDKNSVSKLKSMLDNENLNHEVKAKIRENLKKIS